MIPSSISQGGTALQLLASVDAANTSAATTATGIDISALEGHLVVIQNAGILDAGTLDGAVITSAASNLSSPTTVGTFAQVTTSNDPNIQAISIDLNKCQQYIGYIGTIVTGGALIGVAAFGRAKSV